MATDSSQQNSGTEPPAAPTPEEAEAKFWQLHEERTTAVLDKWFEKKRKELQGGTGTSRTGGRMSLQGLLADLMFGPEKK